MLQAIPGGMRFVNVWHAAFLPRCGNISGQAVRGTIALVACQCWTQGAEYNVTVRSVYGQQSYAAAANAGAPAVFRVALPFSACNSNNFLCNIGSFNSEYPFPISHPNI